MHFKGTDNLSPYFAFGASYGMSSFTLQRDHFSAVNINGETVDQAWGRRARPRSWDVWNYSNVVTASTINVALMFGVDYYFNDDEWV